MGKRSKSYANAKEKIEQKEYTTPDAVTLLQEVKTSKFDESVDLSMKLNVDPKYPDQMIRGTVVLTNGTGKTSRVLVIATGEKQKEAQEAGADFFGGDDMVEKIEKEKWFDFDVLISTPDMMKGVGRLGKVLGPKGLMPSPKAGTVTFNIKEAVEEIKKGRIEYKVDKNGNIHSNVAKISFDQAKITENVQDFVGAILKARPASLKGKYVKSIHISSTMSPSIKLNIQEFEG